MGFSCRHFNVIAGSSEFPTGDTDALRRSRSETLLTKLAQALIDCGVGWQLDTSKNVTTSSFTDIPCNNNSSKTYPGLFFVNTISGCKLFMAYFGDEIQYCGIKDFSGSDLVLYNGYKYHGGVCISIIPGGSSSTFGDPTTSTFLPSDATRICGTFYRSTFGSSSIKYAAAYNPANGYLYSYTILATPYVVSPYCTNNSNGAAPSFYPASNLIYATGRIFGKVLHDETSKNAKYGTYMIRSMTDTNESFAGVISSSVTVFGTSIALPGYNFGQSNMQLMFPSASISRKDGTWILGGDGSQYNTIAMCPDIEMLSDKIFSQSGKMRWIPIFIMFYRPGGMSSDGVTSGDGVKGILDTDLFRCALVSNKTSYDTFDSGKFVVLETSQNLVIGYEPSNIES